MHTKRIMGIMLLPFLFSATNGYCEDYVITLKGNQFSPKDLTVPAGQKVKIIVRNEEAVAAEFESYELNREKIIAPNNEITLFVGPLDAGTYEYFDDFRRDTTKGTITAKLSHIK